MGTESREADGGQHPRRRSLWWAMTSPHRRYLFCCRPLPLSSIAVVVRCCPSWVVVHHSVLSVVHSCLSLVVMWFCVAGVAFGNG